MKHNWEYKRLGDICEIVGGSTPKTEISEYWDGTLNWFTPAEISKQKYYNNSQRKITEEAVRATGLTLMPPGTVLLTSRAPIGKVGIATEYCYCNQGFKNLICNDEIFNEYLYYTLLYFSNVIKDKGRGATFKEISKKVTESIAIPVPPREIQERIVAELDKINEVIEDCRELLRTLDALAQSLFYDYFGGPITNPKGWQTKSIKSISPSDESILAPQEVDGKFWLLNLEQVESNSGRILEIEYFPIENIGSSTVIFDEGNVLYSKLRPYLNKVVIPYGRGYCTSELIPLRPNPTYVTREYIAYALRLPEFVKYINSKTGGAKMPRVKMPHFWNFQMPVPPLELQKKFVERIKQINAQKKAVEETIANLQTLLNSRMDYWFN